jgi:hypothetical protein
MILNFGMEERMKKVSLMLLILVFSLNFMMPKKAHAILVEGSVARVLTATVGERALAAVAEKAGVKFATKSARQIAVRRWNKDLLAQVETIETSGVTAQSTQLRSASNYFSGLTESNVVAIPEKPGFGRILVSTALFLTGADLLVDGYKAIKASNEQQKMLEYMKETTDGLASGELFMNTYGATGIWPYNMNGTDIWTIAYGAIYGANYSSSSWDKTKAYWLTWSTVAMTYHTSSGTVTTDKTLAATVDLVISGINKHYFSTNYGTYRDDKPGNVILNGIPVSAENSYTTVGIVPGVDLVPDTSNITPWAQTYADTGVAVDSDAMRETVPIDIPLTDDYPETVVDPWNEPDADLAPDPVVEPVPDPVPEKLPDDSIPIDDSKCGKPLDMSKIKHLGSVISTSFPFSIPWDIYNAFDSLFGGMSDNGKPDWVFKFSQVGEEFHFSIPNYFDKWMPFIRGIALISWNISLIYALRKWFGGAS